ncbi:MAG: RNA-binding S4 domain-containing protein [Flavobacteriia bacterium]|jgi:ribosome-associated heat shock protein Hsp15|nr:RNA-binding S4 domain-containing protein [Cryomorphaceae bacterium]
MKIRLDKYLWAVRLSKTRSQATELISKGKALLNDAVIKPAREVKVGETITLLKHNARFQYKVLQLLDKRVGAPLVKDYIQDITSPEEIEKLKAYQDAQRNYRQTDGKPTKKDRRELDRFMDDWQEN